MRRAAVLLCLALGACAGHAPATSNGCIAYQPGIPGIFSMRGCATQMDSGWAVMAKHEKFAPAGAVEHPGADLVYFRRQGPAPSWRAPVAGEAVTAYGNPSGGLDLLGFGAGIPTRDESQGNILLIGQFCGVDPKRPACAPAVYFSAKIKRGYSGGPIVGQDGAVVGMTIAYLTQDQTAAGVSLPKGTGIALPADWIRAQHARLIAARP